jgi:predicted XRE-type DNA-binding protein
MCCIASRRNPKNEQGRYRFGYPAYEGFDEGVERMSLSDQVFTSVWDAIEDTPADAENMKIRSGLIMAIRDHIDEKKLSQAEAARLFNVTQPRISELQRGKIDLFSIDKLINMLAHGGLRVELHIAKAA